MQNEQRINKIPRVLWSLRDGLSAVIVDAFTIAVRYLLADQAGGFLELVGRRRL